MPKLGAIKRGNKIGKSPKHYYVWRTCEYCGCPRWVDKYHDSKRCIHCANFGRKMPMEKAGAWKGGILINDEGYRLIRLSPDDFFYPMVNCKGYTFEHRLVMAKYLNRCLLPWEVVHHKNGIKDDNRLENLELLPDKRFHLVDMVIKSHISKLEKRIILLEAENIKLQKQLEERDITLPSIIL